MSVEDTEWNAVVGTRAEHLVQIIMEQLENNDSVEWTDEESVRETIERCINDYPDLIGEKFVCCPHCDTTRRVCIDAKKGNDVKMIVTTDKRRAGELVPETGCDACGKAICDACYETAERPDHEGYMECDVSRAQRREDKERERKWKQENERIARADLERERKKNPLGG